MEIDFLCRHIVEQNEDWVWFVDHSGKFIYTNPSFLKFIEKNKIGTGKTASIEEKFHSIIDLQSLYAQAFSEEISHKQISYTSPINNATLYKNIVLTPIKENNKTFAIACQGKDMLAIVEETNEAMELLNSTLDLICTFDEEGNFVYVSENSFSQWGYAPNEMVGKSFRQFVLEEDLEKTQESARQILEGHKTKSFENRYLKKYGGIAYNLWSAKWDKQKKLLFCVVRDNKEKYFQEELIKQSEQRFKALVQEGSDLISILDIQGNYIYVSPTSVTVLGKTPEEFTGKNAFDFIHSDDQNKTLEYLKKISSEKVVRVEPFRFLNKKGQWRWIETILTNMLDNPAVEGIVANSRDITEKIEEEYKLKLFEKVINSSNDAIVITEAQPLDEPGPRIVYVNESFTKMTEYSAEEVIGKNPRFLQGPNSSKNELKELSRKLKEAQPCDATILNYTKTGKEFWVNLALSPVADHKGSYTHWISIQREVTEQKNKELEQTLLSQLSDCFNEEEELQKVAKNLCKTIVNFGVFDLVELWIPNIEQTEIQLIGSNCTMDFEIDSSLVITRFKKGEGLPGKVWKHTKQYFWEKQKIEKYFVRKYLNDVLKLEAIVAVPLFYKEVIQGVLLLGTRNKIQHLKKYGKIIKRLEQFIGSEIYRKRTENEFKHLFNSIPDILCILDSNGRFLKINEEGCNLLGFSIEEILFQNLQKFIYHNGNKNVQKEFLDLIQSSTSFEFENQFVTKKGEIIWLSWSCKLTEEDGLIYASAKDITNEKKLKLLNQQVGILAKIGSWELDLENQKLYWSDIVHTMHGTDPKIYTPEINTAIDFYREDYREMVSKIFEKSIAEIFEFDFEAVIVTKDLQEKWVRVIGKVEGVNGIAKRIIGSFRDISEKKETDDRLISLANNLPGVVFQYFMYPDGTDGIKHVSNGARNIWGYTAEQAMQNIHLVWQQINEGGDMDRVLQSIQTAVENKTKWNVKFKYVMPNKEIRTYLGNGLPHFLVDGTIVFNSVILDISEEAKTQDLLSQTTSMAKIGSWELDMLNNKTQNLFWSPMTKSILGCEQSFEPSLEKGLEFYTSESKHKVQQALEKLIQTGQEFDLELTILTPKKQEKWVRCIGKSERINDECVKVYGSFQDIHSSKMLEIQIREILESISDAFYAVDSDWCFTYFNKEAENLLHIKECEVIGKNIWEVFPATKDSVLEKKYVEVQETNNAESFEFLYSDDNSWYEVNAYPSKGGISVYFKNINERKIAAQKLRDSLEEKINILESIGDAFITINKEWEVTYWNKSAEELLGHKRHEVLGRNIWELYADTVGTTFYSHYQHAMQTGEIVRFEEKYETIGKWFVITVYPSSNGLSVYFSDITLKKEADLRLIKANERFEKVTEATNDAIWDYDVLNNYLFWGKGFDTLFGYDGTNPKPTFDFLLSLIHPEDREKITNKVSQYFTNPNLKDWYEEYRFLKSDNCYAYVHDRATFIRNPQGEVIRVIGAMNDITERKNFEQQLVDLNKSLKVYAKELERSNEELEQFAFITSHDLQEPLRMISSFMDLLKRKYENQLDEQAQKYIYYSIDGAKRMKQIILDLLDYSRANRPDEDLELVDLNLILSDYFQLRRKKIAESNAHFQYPILPVLKTYKALITQIFHCILDNALKYTRDNISPEIQIEFSENKEDWKFSIADNGIGIDPKFFSKIFVIFQRLHNREKYEGTGIGLSIAKRSVEFLGGKIWLDSEPDKGTTFYFTISKQNLN
jgi:PAS domain S-box-containing protein